MASRDEALQNVGRTSQLAVASIHKIYAVEPTNQRLEKLVDSVPNFTEKSLGTPWQPQTPGLSRIDVFSLEENITLSKQEKVLMAMG